MQRQWSAAIAAAMLLLPGAKDLHAGEMGQRDRVLNVMTRNVDLGSDFGYIFQAVYTDPNDFRALVGAITQTYYEVLASDMPARARALAAEVEAARPDLVSLQEVSRISTGPFGAAATTVVEDQLASVLDALARRGLHYSAIAVQRNLDVTLPSLDTSDQRISLALADFDVVLARSDLPVSQLKIEAVQMGHFAAHPQLALAGTVVDVPRGWIGVDVKLRGKSYRFVDTHLEPADLAIQAAETFELLSGILDSPVPVVLAGDLKSDAHAPSFARGPAYGILASAGFVDAWATLHPSDAGLTWPMFGEDPPLGPATPFERIDLVLARGAGIVPTEAIRTGTSAPFASDHAGVAATFSLLP